jgi:hypothetical protein
VSLFPSLLRSTNKSINSSSNRLRNRLRYPRYNFHFHHSCLSPRDNTLGLYNIADLFGHNNVLPHPRGYSKTLRRDSTQGRHNNVRWSDKRLSLISLRLLKECVRSELGQSLAPKLIPGVLIKSLVLKLEETDNTASVRIIGKVARL